MRQLWTDPNGDVGMRVTLAALAIGVGWVVYLNWLASPLPPDVLRLVPVVWLVLAILGLLLGIEGVKVNVHRYRSLLSILLCLPNIPLAAVFTLAAMMGD